MAVSDVTTSASSPKLCLHCDSPCDLSSCSAFSCAHCGLYAHFRCAGFGFAKPNKPTAKLLDLKCVRLVCGICADRPPSPKSSIEAQIASLSSQVKRMSDFLAPVEPSRHFASQPHPKPSVPSSFSKAPALSRPPASFPEAIAQATKCAIEASRRDEEAARSVIFRGLPVSEGVDPGPPVNEVLEFLGLSHSVRVLQTLILKPSLRSHADPKDPAAARPPLVKVILASPDQARALLQSAKLLKDAELSGFRSCFIRPDRTPDDARSLRISSQRRDSLRASEVQPEVSYVVCYSKPGFPVLRLLNGKPDWKWVDTGMPEWLASRPSGHRSQPRSGTGTLQPPSTSSGTAPSYAAVAAIATTAPAASTDDVPGPSNASPPPPFAME
jgi:hypothetical protein